MASCALHNFLRRTPPDTYTPPKCFDTEDLQNGTVTAGLRSNPSNMATLKRGNNRNRQLTGKEVRSQFVEYFNDESKVPWQDNCIWRSILSTTFILNLLGVYSTHTVWMRCKSKVNYTKKVINLPHCPLPLLAYLTLNCVVLLVHTEKEVYCNTTILVLTSLLQRHRHRTLVILQPFCVPF